LANKQTNKSTHKQMHAAKNIRLGSLRHAPVEKRPTVVGNVDGLSARHFGLYA